MLMRWCSFAPFVPVCQHALRIKRTTLMWQNAAIFALCLNSALILLLRVSEWRKLLFLDHVDDAFSVMTFGAELLQGDIACPFGKAAASAVCHHRVMAPCCFRQAEQFLQNTVQRCHRQQIRPRG